MNTAMTQHRNEQGTASRTRDPAAAQRDLDAMLSLLRATLVGLSMQHPLGPPSRVERT